MEPASEHHETKTMPDQKTANTVTTTATHPLQDVQLSQNESISDMQSAAKSKSKENWVTFDDEVNGTSEKNNNKNSASLSGNTETEHATFAAINENRLSSLPPPPVSAKHQKQRPTTPSESNSQFSPNTREVISSPVQHGNETGPDVAPAVLTTESTHVDLNASGKTLLQQQQQQQQQQHPQQQLHQKQQLQQYQKSKAASALNTTTTATAAAATTTNSKISASTHQHNNGTPNTAAVSSATIPIEAIPPMRTIELSTGRIREGFANGDVIVTLLPANTKWPWVTPAIFRPELVPEELMAQGLTLTVEEYVAAMETLVNDYRFTLYNICYKRILCCWIIFAFAVLLAVLFSGLQGMALFALGVAWLFINASAIFLCMWAKLRLSRGLEKCLARVNKQLIKHKILLILDDRGHISCHKVNLCFLYFDSMQCVQFLNTFLEQMDQNGGDSIKAGWEAKLDIDMDDIVIQGTNPVRLSRKQALAQELYLSYLQRWGKDFLRRRLDWTVQEAGVHEMPRHLQSSICPCQYEEEILRNKIKTHLKRKQCCGIDCIGCWL